jgi:hypothetical protein
LVDYEVDPYKLGLSNFLDGGGDTFFRSQRHNRSPNIPYNEVCIPFT